MTYKITDIDPVTMTIEELEGLVVILNATIKRKKAQSEVYDKIFSSMNEILEKMSHKSFGGYKLSREGEDPMK